MVSGKALVNITIVSLLFMLALVTINIANRWKNIVEANDYKNHQRASLGTFRVKAQFPSVSIEMTEGFKGGQEFFGQQFKQAIMGRLVSLDLRESSGGEEINPITNAVVVADLYADVRKDNFGNVLWETKPVVVGRKISLLSPDGCCSLKGGVIDSVSFSDEAMPLAPYRLSKND
ncbi:hypothetical protein LCGC14_0679910 [marine sediment metagenome]|uniref:Uncharacterized protein n=1 Tax=marine sediment metagenome TaxID=412755 RepID=A0A0F9TWM8_9ZZZZ